MAPHLTSHRWPDSTSTGGLEECIRRHLRIYSTSNQINEKGQSQQTSSDIYFQIHLDIVEYIFVSISSI